MPRHIALCAALILGCAFSLEGQTDREAHLQWMQENLPECPEFNMWQSASGTLPPDFSSLRSDNRLPDPLRFEDGTMVRTESDWQRRRAEILSLYEKYEFGTFPPKPRISRVEVLEEKMDGDCLSRSVKLIFGPHDKGSVRVSLTFPSGHQGEKFPVLLSPTLGGFGNTLLRRGYISAGFAGSDFADDGAALRELYPEYSFATLPRRAWLISIVLDYFETVPEIDMDKVAIYGYSRDGKMAAIAAARDERVKALVAGSTGVGGFVPWRYAGERYGGESIESTTRMFPDWYRPELRFFSGKEDRLPVDANLLLSLIAPRAVLMEWGFNDEVANGWAQERVYDSALPVYEMFGAGDRVSLLSVPGFHGSNDIQASIDFLDIQFGRSDAAWSYTPVFPWDFDKWKRSSGESLDPADYPAHKNGGRLARNTREWEARKPALKASVEQMLGEKPATAGIKPAFFKQDSSGPVEMLKGKFRPGQLGPDVPAWVMSKKSSEFGWTEEDGAVAASRRISFGPDNVQADLYYPAGTPEGASLPVVIWLHGFHYPLGYMWVYRRDIHPVLALVKEGYAVLAYDQTGFGSRYGEYAKFYDRYPHWSRLGRMVEDVSGAIDALGKESLVDISRISVFGYAMGGTVALYAGALDGRISNIVSVCGFSPMRSDKPGTPLSGMSRYSHLFAMQPRLGFFLGQEERLPYDFDDLIALCAPRNVLIVQPTMDRDADCRAVREAVSRAAGIYTMSGAAGNLKLMEPDDYARMTSMTQINIIKWLKER